MKNLFFKKIVKIGISLLLSFCIFFGFSKKAEAIFGIGDISFDPANFVQNLITAIATPVTSFGTQPVIAGTNVAGLGKEIVADPIANVITKSIISGITAQTVNWINSGFKGKPAFLTNPERFFRNQGDIILEKAIGRDLDLLCQPFALQVRLALVKTYLQEAQPPNCTVERIAETWQNWGKNLKRDEVWKNWFQITQIDQNNPYGAKYMAEDFIRLQQTATRQKYDQQIVTGKGFLSFEKCKKYAGQTTPNRTYDAGSAIQGTIRNICTRRAPLETGNPKSGECLESKNYITDSEGNEIEVNDKGVPLNNRSEEISSGECLVKETVTPGSVISSQLEKVLGSSVSQLELADEINEIASALMIQLFNRALNGAMGGLRGLTNKGADEDKPFLERIKVSDTALGPINANTPESIKEEQERGVEKIDDSSNKIPEFIEPNGNSRYIDPSLVESLVDSEAARLEAKYGELHPPTTTTDGNQTDPLNP